jgi:hypothetical protein
LLRVLGYEKIGGVYASADRKAVFVGDLIDRGPAIGETLEIVKAMVDAGSGICAMGNHEFNALAFHTPDGTGSYVRPHSEKNIQQHAKTLEFFASRPGAQEHYLKWFWSLPLWLPSTYVWMRHGWVLCYIECNRACSDGDSVPYRNFMTISSDVYPDLALHYGRLIDRWVNAYALSEITDEEAEE